MFVGYSIPLEILIDDEDEQTRLDLELALRAEHHCPSSVENGEQALEVLEQFTFDLLLLDVEMSVLGGIETLRRIRINPAHRELRIYAMTAYPDGAEMEAQRMAGFSGCLVKPVSLAALAAVLTSECKPAAPTVRTARPLVDSMVWGECQNLMRSAGTSPWAVVKRTLDPVSKWLEGGPECLPESREAAYALAGSCTIIGASALSMGLWDVRRLAAAGEGERWNASLLHLKQVLMETTRVYGSLTGGLAAVAAQ